MRIAMIGTGYVGLVSGVCFSDFGHEVVCVDKDPAKLEKLGRGEVPIFEPGLDALMARNVEAGRLSFTGDLKTAVAEAEAVYRADLGLDTTLSRASIHPDNIWSLKGLYDCLKSRNETVEIRHIKQKLDQAQARSDGVFSSCGCSQIAMRN